jgi:uncharacterized membrane protein YagU involved in acid resistance
MNGIVRGAAAGLIGTGTMSLALAGSKAMGLMGAPPPKRITTNLARKVGLAPHKHGEETLNATWIAAHLGYGLAAGEVYTLVHRVVPLPGAVVGPAYGLALWALSYFKLMPAMGLFPPPERQSPTTHLVMATAHLLYGASAGVAEQYL